VTTIYDAERAGEIAGLSSKGSVDDVPADFATRKALIDAWQSGFNRTRQAFRGVPVEAEKKPRIQIETDDAEDVAPKKGGKPKKGSNMLTEPTPEPIAEPEPLVPMTMDSAFMMLHPEARECA
jgi:hypothetical protein